MTCFRAIGLGTMFGGWRIVKTMGQRITQLKPISGFAAECAGSITLFMATRLIRRFLDTFSPARGATRAPKPGMFACWGPEGRWRIGRARLIGAFWRLRSDLVHQGKRK